MPDYCVGVVLILTGHQVSTKAALSLTSSAGQGGQNKEALVGRNKARERSLASYCHSQSRLEEVNLLSIK